MGRITIISILALITLQSCYIGKRLETEQKVRIITDADVNVQTAIEGKYASEQAWQSYKQNLLDGIRSEFTYYNLYDIGNQNIKADFTLVLKKIYVSESTSTETVSDAASEFNGKSFTISSCNVTCTFDLYLGEKYKLLGSWEAFANKDEKISNNRNFGDYVFGTNKDNSEYRYKELDDNIMDKLSEKCGRRVTVKITKKITKHQKK